MAKTRSELSRRLGKQASDIKKGRKAKSSAAPNKRPPRFRTAQQLDKFLRKRGILRDTRPQSGLYKNGNRVGSYFERTGQNGKNYYEVHLKANS